MRKNSNKKDAEFFFTYQGIAVSGGRKHDDGKTGAADVIGETKTENAERGWVGIVFRSIQSNKMHVKEQRVGYFLGEIPNERIPNLSSLPQMNEIALRRHALQNQRDFQSDWRKNPEIKHIRTFISKRITEILSRQPKIDEWKRKLPNFVHHFEGQLYKDAASQEEYMNQETLNHRLEFLLTHASSTCLCSSSSSISMSIPVITHCGSSLNSLDPLIDNFMNARTGCDMVVRDNINHSDGFLVGEQLRAFDGSLENGYDLGVARTSFAYDGSNVLSLVGRSRVASRMIPTQQDIVKFQSRTAFSMENVVFNNGTVNASQQQSMQYASSQVGFFARSFSMSQRHPFSYEFQNGARNDGTPFAERSVQYINKAALSSPESYLSPSTHVSVSKSQQQHLDQQIQQQQMQGEVDLMRFFSRMGNNENAFPEGCLSTLERNSGVQQSSLHIIQQIPQKMSGDFDILTKMIVKGPSSIHENLLQSPLQMQKLYQFQQQPYLQPTMANPSGKAHGTDPSNGESMQSKFPEKHQLSKSCITHQQPLEQSSMLNLLMQDDFRSQIAGEDVTQQPQLSSGGPNGGVKCVASENLANLCHSNRAAGSGDSTGELKYSNQHKFLLFYIRFRNCPVPKGKFKVPFIYMMHQKNCLGRQCNCDKYRKLLSHYHNCRDDCCPICGPVRNLCISHQFDSGLEKLKSGTRRAFNDRDAGGPISDTSEERQYPLKHLKIEHPSLPLLSKNEASQVLAPSVNQPGPLHGLSHMHQLHNDTVSVNSEVMEMNMEPFTSPIQVPTSFSEIKNDVPDGSVKVNPDEEPVIRKELITSCKEEDIQDGTTFNQIKPEIKSDFTAPVAGHAVRMKSGEPEEGVSLTEIFTSEQIKEHISSLRQWRGQSKAEVEKNSAMAHCMNKNSCQLCTMESIFFKPPQIYCSSCNAGFKRNGSYYSTVDKIGYSRHCFCTSCYKKTRDECFTVNGLAIHKSKLEIKTNDEETGELWVQCDKCDGWQHQICALFNDKRNAKGKAEYICPYCYIHEIDTGQRMLLPQSAILGAKDLPRTMLSDHIEQRLFRRLKQEREERAKVMRNNLDEVPGEETLFVRVVLSVDKQLEVKPRFLDTFQEDNYPAKFPYRSKVIVLFQKIDGVDVCLFIMYVQEFGSKCCYPNQRCVYLSYLDSVKYFRPETRTIMGEALRTFVYHEILIGYLDYCKKRGYLAMLRKAVKENIVVNITNLYDHFFVPNDECKAKITVARLPYFDGDHWPALAEDMVTNIEQEGEGRLHRKVKKPLAKRTLKAVGHTDPSGNPTKDMLLMQKLGKIILPNKEDFILVQLQFTCTCCCELIVSGRRWYCNQCKKIQLCEKCHDAEQNLDERNKHPICSREKHVLSQDVVNDVPSDTEDNDSILDNEFFESRHTFLSFCQINHYQYDTLRRAKHSSTMILYHLHNPTEPADVSTSSI
ncbi:hypothetical protein HHK36_024339 [Tetracentron sinense]|uniref:histone acetyltransferase n=1 Tax=Tetracentron sinense TaxID=13715 RepID=A0A834YN05_TETSI|nr:hypothetical protein HHK36_024339 [Tetracentron sinense]